MILTGSSIHLNTTSFAILYTQQIISSLYTEIPLFFSCTRTFLKTILLPKKPTNKNPLNHLTWYQKIFDRFHKLDSHYFINSHESLITK